MSELLSLIAVYQGVSFIYMFLHLKDAIHVYSEVENKINFIPSLRKIDKLKILDKIETSNKIYEAYETFAYINTSTDTMKTTEEKKKNLLLSV